MESDLRILHVIPGSSHGNSMVFAKRQAAALAPHVDKLEIFFPVFRSPRGFLRSFVELKREILHGGYDIVHAHYGTITAMMCILAKGKARIIIVFRGSDINPAANVSWLRNRVQKFLSYLSSIAADHVICVSEELRRHLWWRRSAISVMPTGCDVQTFMPMCKAHARAMLQHRLPRPDDWPLILFNAGSTPEFKGERIVRDALLILWRERGMRCHLVVTRNDILPEHMPTLLNACDVVVLASLFEGSPTILQEALACNKAVVSTPAGDAAVRLAEVNGSYCVAERTPQALAEGLMQALAYDGKRNGREIAMRDCDQRILAKRVFEIYKELAG